MPHAADVPAVFAKSERKPSSRASAKPSSRASAKRSKPPLSSPRLAPCALYLTGQGWARQISFAYSEIVRSLENLPEAAILRMTLCAQSSGC